MLSDRATNSDLIHSFFLARNKENFRYKKRRGEQKWISWVWWTILLNSIYSLSKKYRTRCFLSSASRFFSSHSYFPIQRYCPRISLNSLEDSFHYSLRGIKLPPIYRLQKCVTRGARRLPEVRNGAEKRGRCILKFSEYYSGTPRNFYSDSHTSPRDSLIIRSSIQVVKRNLSSINWLILR